jgi:hypothetical protein
VRKPVEDVFRRANAALLETYQALRPGGVTASGLTPFICECSDNRCTRVIQLTLDEYESVQSQPGHFAVVPGHVVRDFAHVAEENERYAVLVKDGQLAQTY